MAGKWISIHNDNDGSVTPSLTRRRQKEGKSVFSDEKRQHFFIHSRLSRRKQDMQAHSSVEEVGEWKVRLEAFLF